MTGIEVAIGMLVAWLARKAKRVGAQIDSDVDDVVDAGVVKLHNLVASTLGTDPGLVKLHAEVEQTGDASDRTKERVKLAVAQAFDDAPGFQERFLELVSEIAAARAGRGGVVAQHDVITVGDMIVKDRSFGIGVVSGNVTMDPKSEVSTEPKRPDPS